MPRIRFFPRLFNKTVVAESSTAAHFAEGYEDAFAGTAEDEFYGIPLSNDLSVASFGDKFGLFLLLLAIIYVKPRIDVLNRRPELSRAFWIAVLAASYSLRELTWIPLLTTVVYTRTTYPYLVVIPHCIAAAASYRTERAQRPGSGALHWLPSFAFGFFCYGFGGSIVSDLLMGLPITALGHARIVPCYVVGWCLVWYSPWDFVYASYKDPQSFVHYFLTSCEAVDAVTTPMGRVSRSARELKNKLVAPVLAGLFAGSGGAALRYAERVVLRGVSINETTASFKALEAGVWKTLGYSVLWWYLVVWKCDFVNHEDNDEWREENNCPTYNGSDRIRVVLVLCHVLWALMSEAGMLGGGHPFLWMIKTLQGNFLVPLAKRFKLGQQQRPSKKV